MLVVTNCKEQVLTRLLSPTQPASILFRFLGSSDLVLPLRTV